MNHAHMGAAHPQEIFAKLCSLLSDGGKDTFEGNPACYGSLKGGFVVIAFDDQGCGEARAKLREVYETSDPEGEAGEHYTRDVAEFRSRTQLMPSEAATISVWVAKEDADRSSMPSSSDLEVGMFVHLTTAEQDLIAARRIQRPTDGPAMFAISSLLTTLRGANRIKLIELK